MIQVMAFLVLTVLGFAVLVGICILVIRCIIASIGKRENPKQLSHLKRAATLFAALAILNTGLVALTQMAAFTPPIVDESGHSPENSIAELTEVELNGRKQWISLRGWDKSKPVLLFLAGGPGGTQMAAVRHELAELEKYFVVVNWDQPGSGKSYYAEKTGIPPEDIYVVSIMPCIAKKFEAQRPELKEVYADVDAVLTTRELARMIKNAGIDFTRLADEHFDDPMGESTGAAVIFGAAGGVMEAALRTAHFFLTGKDMENVEFTPVRGLQGVKEGEVTIAGITIKIAAVSGLKNIGLILDKIRSGENTYQFIEVMACPNGCINGGGQPINADPEKVRKRMEAIYAIDRTLPKRASHHNEGVMRLYKEYLGEPNGHRAHELLHTHYVERS